MARKRMIHPEFFLSDDVAALSVHARLTFIGLWCYFDDDGRGKDSPAAVRVAVWGMDADITPSRVADWLDEIETVGGLCRYEIDGNRYMHAPTWTTWQSISHPADPRIPPCPVHGGRPAKTDGRGRRARTAENYGESRKVSPQVVSQSDQESAVQGVRRASPVDNYDCEHGVDRFSSCMQCAKSKQVSA